MSRRIKVPMAAFLVALALAVFAPAVRVIAEQQMDMMKMMMAAKTPADHEKLAKHYEQEAAAARAKADLHKKMAEEIRKGGGALFAKVHYDEHCEALAASYTKAAEEYEALAKAERDMAKM